MSQQPTVVVSFDLDAEEVWLGEDPANAGRPGVLSQGAYGPRVAVPLLLDLLERLGVRASFFVPGRVGERHPEAVRAVVAAGHEVGHHGYTHTSPTRLDPDAEEAEVLRGLEVLHGLGAEVRGYRSPSWELSAVTLDLLERHGFAYSSNLMDDVRPYRHEGRSIVEVPVHWTLDDAPHFWFSLASWDRTIRSAAEVRALWEEELDGYRRVGGTAVLTMHPQIIGRPGRLAMLESLLAGLVASGTRLATAGEVAAALP